MLYDTAPRLRLASSQLLPLTVTLVGSLPLAGFLPACSPVSEPPLPPTTIEEGEDLDNVEFCSDRTKLVGGLLIPQGEGSFPAIVLVHSLGQAPRPEYDPLPDLLQAPGFYVLGYDICRVGASTKGDASLVEGRIETSEWRVHRLADDELAAVTFVQNLQEIQADQIGLTGRGRAGWNIPLAASRSDLLASTPWFFLIAILGHGRRFLNSSRRFLTPGGQASYPLHIPHQTVIAIIGSYVAQWKAGSLIKYVTILVTATIVMTIICDLLVKRTDVTRFLFGMRPRKKWVEEPAARPETVA